MASVMHERYTQCRVRETERMRMNVKNLNEISDISETLLIPLYSRAIESQSCDPIIVDDKAVEITRMLNQELVESDKKLYKKLIKGELPKKLVVTLALRTRQFDRYILDFFEREPNGIVVNMGCGLDTRFFRIDNEKAEWHDLDFPEVIELKKQYMNENDRYHFIESSVLDFNWMEELSKVKDRKFFFIAEGVFMYLHEEDVKSLVLKLQATFPGAELACEVAHQNLVKKMQKGYYKWKFKKRLSLSENAAFTFGVPDEKYMESWNSGIKFLDEWTYFDEYERKLGWFNLFRKIEYFKKIQWVVHYKLSSNDTAYNNILPQGRG